MAFHEFTKEERDEIIGTSLSLSDYLAYQRTDLACTRTLLSFSRTGLSILISGIGIVRLADIIEYCYPIGLILMCCAPIFPLFGLYNYWHTKTKYYDSAHTYIEKNKQKKSKEKDSQNTTENTRDK